MLGDGFDIDPLTVPVPEGTSHRVNHLADVSLLDDDARPHRGQDRLLGDQRAAVSYEMDECLKRLFRKGDALTPFAALEPVLADIEPELAELVYLDGPVRHGDRRRNEKGMRTSRNPKDASAGGA